MLGLQLGEHGAGVLSVLCLGAHCDDIEIGCGGTILRLLEEHRDVRAQWVILSSDGVREREARESAEEFLRRAAYIDIFVERFRNGFFPSLLSDIKEYFERLKTLASPDIIFTHYGQDFHQDHRVVSELTWNTFRDHLILEYEIPKYDGGLGSPSIFSPLEDRHRSAKIQALMDHFGSQADKRWFSPETFNGLARLRGVECNAASGYAEAFYCRKAVLRWERQRDLRGS